MFPKNKDIPLRIDEILQVQIEKLFQISSSFIKCDMIFPDNIVQSHSPQN